MPRLNCIISSSVEIKRKAYLTYDKYHIVKRMIIIIMTVYIVTTYYIIYNFSYKYYCLSLRVRTTPNTRTDIR